jgi:CHAT domain-containing protein
VIKARQDFKPLQRDQLRALLIAVPAAVGRTPLPKAEYEVRQVEDLIHSTSVKSQTAISPDVHTVLDGLPNAHILHLACHGIQKENALDSHFLLADGPLSVATLAKLDLPNAVFAFLSTCEAAKGDKNQPDQAVHLAASLLFCGFRSIIGTMW